MIAIKKPVVRKVVDLHGKVLVAALAPEGVWIRPYRSRTGFLLPYDTALYRAQVLAADATRVVTPRPAKKRRRS